MGLVVQQYNLGHASNGILLINVGFKVLFDQSLGNPTSCLHQTKHVIISSTCSFEHIEVSELYVVHQFNLDIHIMFFH
jgi:hypothetical protein